MLGGGVPAAAVVDLERRDGRDRDDEPVAGLDELGQQRPGHPQRADHVGLPHPAPVLEVGVGDRLQALGPAGVVDQHVDPVQLRGQRVDGGGVSDVRHNRGPADLVGDGLDPVFPAGHADHVKAKSGKGFRGRLADARTGAGDDRDPLMCFECRHPDRL